MGTASSPDCFACLVTRHAFGIPVMLPAFHMLILFYFPCFSNHSHVLILSRRCSPAVGILILWFLSAFCLLCMMSLSLRCRDSTVYVNRAWLPHSHLLSACWPIVDLWNSLSAIKRSFFSESYTALSSIRLIIYNAIRNLIGIGKWQ